METKVTKDWTQVKQMSSSDGSVKFGIGMGSGGGRGRVGRVYLERRRSEIFGKKNPVFHSS